MEWRGLPFRKGSGNASRAGTSCFPRRAGTGAPIFDAPGDQERTIASVDWIFSRRTYLQNHCDRPLMLSGRALIFLVLPVRRIRANDDQVLACGERLVSGPRREHDDV